MSPLEAPEGDDKDHQMKGAHGLVRFIMVCYDDARLL